MSSCFLDGSIEIGIAGLSVHGICLATLVIILCISIKRLQSQKYQLLIKIIYFLTSIISICTVSIIFIFTIICSRSSLIINIYTISLYGLYGLNGLCILATLLSRLYFSCTDKDLDTNWTTFNIGPEAVIGSLNGYSVIYEWDIQEFDVLVPN